MARVGPELKVLASVAALMVWSCGEPAGPLRKVGAVPLPDGPSRFDYQSMDPRTGLLYVSHMGAGKVAVFDTRKDKVAADLAGYRTVTGVLAVPEEGKLYASAAGTHELVVASLGTNLVEKRIHGLDFPDGIAYAPKQRRIFVSDESGGDVVAIDARSNAVLKKIPLGGEAGNTHYDPFTGKVWVAVQSRNEMAAIDPGTLAIVARRGLAGADHPHGWTCLNGVGYISCEGNNRLIVTDMAQMKVLQSLDVTDGPDVLAIDQGLRRLYVACEGGAVNGFRILPDGTLRPIGKFVARNAHTVAVDATTHRVYLPLQDVDGKPELWILEPEK